MSADKYEKDSVNATLARIEERQENYSEQMKAFMADMKKHNEDSEKRITALERSKYWVIGAAAGFTFCARALWEWMTNGPKH